MSEAAAPEAAAPEAAAPEAAAPEAAAPEAAAPEAAATEAVELAQCLVTADGPPSPPPWPELYVFSTDPDRIVCLQTSLQF